MVSSGKNRWLYCPLVPEGIIKFSVMPTGIKFRFLMNYRINFHDFFFQNDQKYELDSDVYVKICGYHFYMYIWLIILFSTEKVKLSHLK